MRTYFVASDIHSFFDCFRDALKQAGFRKTNPDHILVICGDVFDRGHQTMEVYDFIRSIPKKRRIMIRGNHEWLFGELLMKTYPDKWDFSNGTVRTFCAIAGVDQSMVKPSYWYAKAAMDGLDLSTYRNKPAEVWADIRRAVRDSDVARWIASKEWIDYAEIGKYVLVHGFIPARLKPEAEANASWYPVDSMPVGWFEYDPDWRSAKDWSEAVWGCPWQKYKAGLFAPEEEAGKTLICGHWHAYDFKRVFDGANYRNQDDIDFTPYFSDGLIAIDACTAQSGMCNVIRIQESADGSFELVR